MKCNYIILLVTFFITTAINAQQKNNIEAITVNPFTIGEIAVIQSNILNEERTINIYLPAGYTINNQKEYPVIYLLDGSANEDFIHISGIVQFGSFPWIEMLPESIVIGIANVDRKRDFTFPTKNVKDKIDFPTTGESAKFIRFLEEELQPFVEKNGAVVE